MPSQSAENPCKVDKPWELCKGVSAVVCKLELVQWAAPTSSWQPATARAHCISFLGADVEAACTAHC